MLEKPRLCFANVASALALFVALGTGGAYATTTYLVSSNTQVGPDVVAGHHPPEGEHANVIADSITSQDLMVHTVGAAQLAAPDGWHAVAPAPRNATYPCDHGVTAVFCEVQLFGNGTGTATVENLWWDNAGGAFAPAAYTRDLDGIVRLRGLVSVFSDSGCCSLHFPVFLLPVSYRPAHELVFTTVDNGSTSTYTARVDVMPDGRVLPRADQGGTDGKLLSLDGISFRVGE
jgi:hypothetical protein